MESNGVAGTAQFGPCTGGVPAQKRRKVKYDLHQRMYVIMQFFIKSYIPNQHLMCI